MRKSLAVLLVLSLVLAIPIMVHANENSDVGVKVVHTVPIEDVAYIPDSSSTGSEGAITPYAANLFEFVGVNPNVLYPYSATYTISSGTFTTLRIKECMWAPADCDVEIGLYHLATGTCYGEVYDYGDLENGDTQYHYNLPSGSYWVYAINLGPVPLTTGIMEFTVS